MNDHDPQQLEHSIDRLLRAQPARRAPRDLSQRVLTEIARREALPWWQRGFHSWPTYAQAVFCTLCLALVAIALELPAWIAETVNANIPLTFNRALSLWHTLGSLGTAFADSLPMQWLYVGGGLIALAYITLFGTGMATYRMLFESPR